MLVLRPADAEETTQAWRLAMENTTTPTGLIFSRQNITSLPAGNDYTQVAKGAYIVAGSEEQADVILVASGSEVATLVDGAALLRRAARTPPWCTWGSCSRCGRSTRPCLWPLGDSENMSHFTQKYIPWNRKSSDYCETCCIGK